MGIFTRKGSDGNGVGLEPFSDLLTEEDTRLTIDEGDHESAVTGKPVRALCGKKWVPSRDPEKFPICPMCKKIYEELKHD